LIPLANAASPERLSIHGSFRQALLYDSAVKGSHLILYSLYHIV